MFALRQSLEIVGKLTERDALTAFTDVALAPAVLVSAARRDSTENVSVAGPSSQQLIEPGARKNR
ncbi:MAG: hypothetical protein F4Z53_00445 [Acidimicrobiales bacterium]|nr:hypothetical protein [Acidimicrobiales bacterium]MYD33005.1 hypothetical protein [Acidimicrobiales bacterium]MYI08557.1 hypothetical protein [Acidimicrobiales bacterium]